MEVQEFHRLLGIHRRIRNGQDIGNNTSRVFRFRTAVATAGLGFT